MPDLPSGTVIFLFTDIEGSTALWERDRTAMAAAVERHIALLDAAILTHGGVHFKTVGDAVQAAFATAAAAVATAIETQRALMAEPWQTSGPLRVRMAIHAGEATPGGEGYRSPALNRLERLLGAGHGGQILLSAVAQALVVNALPRDASLIDLGEHRLRDLQEPERIFQLVHPELPVEFPPLSSLDAPRSNLPHQSTLFVGRERELEDIARLLGDETVRLLTLTGPGGAGKTRLALQSAAALRDHFADGVYVVPLASLTDAGLAPAAIATTLGIRESAGQTPREQLLAELAEKRMLLVLDNLEQIPSISPFIGELLAAVPDLSVLATSRAPLHLRAEREYPVPPLPLPPGDPALGVEEISRYGAVRLFVDRAQAVKRDFAVDAANAAAVSEIVRRLDGLPLAIELAAARSRLFTPQALLQRLEKRLPLLTGGARDLPTRQRALRETIAWSYDLLSVDDRILFRHLALFAGGMTLEAAEHVGGRFAKGGRGGEGGESVLDGVERLVEHSLLHMQPEAESDSDVSPRFGMLETIREYGLERLMEEGEADAAGSRHAGYFLQLVERATPELDGPEQGTWLDRIAVEHDNLHVALDWASNQPGEATALRLAAALWPFWDARGHYTEGRAWLERALAHDATAPKSVLAAALSGAGSIARMQGDSRRAVDCLQQALRLWQELGDRRGAARALLTLGHVADRQGDLTAAASRFEDALALGREIDDSAVIAAALGNLGIVADQQGAYMRAAERYEEALALFRQLGDRRREAASLDNLGIVARAQGRLADATRFYEEAMAVRRAVGDAWGIAATLGNLGVVTHQGGDLDQARDYYEQSLQGFRTLGDRRGIANTLGNLGVVARQVGDLARAAALQREALQIAWDLGDQVGVATEISGIADVAAVKREPERAARLYGAAATLREAIGVPVTPDDRADHDQSIAAVRAGLDDAQFTTAWNAGSGLSLEDAVTEALALAREIAAAESVARR
ncbi:MAG: adenylate/guanylate cyclase protein [Thermomicrobiales bacterium]|nr:adenylate/guanylate cyclase protein [Thermomicrobiales bacterium]